MSSHNTLYLEQVHKLGVPGGRAQPVGQRRLQLVDELRFGAQELGAVLVVGLQLTRHKVLYLLLYCIQWDWSTATWVHASSCESIAPEQKVHLRSGVRHEPCPSA